MEGEDNPSSLGSDLNELVKRYGLPNYSKAHADVAEKIRVAVIKKDRNELMLQLGNFAATKSAVEGEEVRIDEAACFEDTKKVMADVQNAGELPWNELRDALGIKVMESAPSAQVAGVSPEASQNTEEFIGKFVLHNERLNYAAKEFMVNMARAKTGPWNEANHVTMVRQAGKKITVAHRKGETHFMMK